MTPIIQNSRICRRSTHCTLLGYLRLPNRSICDKGCKNPRRFRKKGVELCWHCGAQSCENWATGKSYLLLTKTQEEKQVISIFHNPQLECSRILLCPCSRITMMDHIRASTLHFMNHDHTRSRFTMSKLSITKQVSFDRMNMGCRSNAFNTFVGTKRLITKEELPIQSMKYSHLVGGFVGSKSQLGTSSRISCQIWDIVFSKLMPFLNSPNIEPASPLKSSEYSYMLVQDLATDMFDSMYRDISEPKEFASSYCVPAHYSENHNMPSNPISEHQLLENSKQSYADVTKTAKHAEAMKCKMKPQNITFSKKFIEKQEMVPAGKMSSSKRKKRCFRRKRANTTNYNADKNPNCHKEGNQFHKNEKRRKSNSKMSSIKREKDVTSDVSTNTKCCGKDTVNCANKHLLSGVSSLNPVKQLNFPIPLCVETEVEFLAPVEKNSFHSQIKIIPNNMLQQCDKKDELPSSAIKVEDTILLKRPSFSCVHRISRTYSDSSESDDFVIFAVAESDESTENDSEEEKRDEEILDMQDEKDNQLAEDLKAINERWQKMYSCIQGVATEPTKVCFAPDDKLKTVHSIIAWDFAYRAARIGPWEQIGRDQERFKQRIQKLEKIISPVLTIEHRLHVYQRTVKSTSAGGENDQHCD